MDDRQSGDHRVHTTTRNCTSRSSQQSRVLQRLATLAWPVHSASHYSFTLTDPVEEAREEPLEWLGKRFRLLSAFRSIHFTMALTDLDDDDNGASPSWPPSISLFIVIVTTPLVAEQRPVHSKKDGRRNS